MRGVARIGTSFDAPVMALLEERSCGPECAKVLTLAGSTIREATPRQRAAAGAIAEGQPGHSCAGIRARRLQCRRFCVQGRRRSTECRHSLRSRSLFPNRPSAFLPVVSAPCHFDLPQYAARRLLDALHRLEKCRRSVTDARDASIGEFARGGQARHHHHVHRQGDLVA